MATAQDDSFGVLIDELPDITFIVGSEKTPMFAHKKVLSSRSDYFDHCFNRGFAESHKAVIEKPNISPSTFGVILQFLYLGSFPLDQLTRVENMELLVAASEFAMDDLCKHCSNYLINSSNCVNKPELLLFAVETNMHDIVSHCLLDLVKALPIPELWSDYCKWPLEHVPDDILKNFLDSLPPSITPEQRCKCVLLWAIKQCHVAVSSLVCRGFPTWSAAQHSLLRSTMEPFLAYIDFNSIPLAFFESIERLQLLPSNIVLDRLRAHAWPQQWQCTELNT
eukprot:GILJ01003243.1.p1 GENE.GILJ01003243.1~~GILJ01003243.1.p1  ORF type:complete len:293 (+),score=32.60 GILJ01003243.1:41-880(+)